MFLYKSRTYVITVCIGQRYVRQLNCKQLYIYVALTNIKFWVTQWMMSDKSYDNLVMEFHDDLDGQSEVDNQDSQSEDRVGDQEGDSEDRQPQ